MLGSVKEVLYLVHVDGTTIVRLVPVDSTTIVRLVFVEDATMLLSRVGNTMFS